VTLQRRVLAYLALAAVVSCALTVGVAVVLVRHRVASQRAAALRAQANLLATVGGAPRARQPGIHVYRIGPVRPRLVRPRLASQIGVGLARERAADGTLTVAGRSLLYAARPTAVGEIVLVRSTRLAFAEWRPFLVSLGLAGAGGAVLAVLLSLMLSRRLTRPIGRLAAATRAVAAGRSGVAVPAEGGDELAALGRSFNTMAHQLEQAREAQRAFLESVSHELKTPLTSIRGYAEALGDGALAAGEVAPVLVSESDRLERLVGDLLDLARLGRPGFTFSRQAVDLTQIASEVVRRHQPRADELGVALALSGAPPAAAPAQGDEGRLLQVVSNLVENAIRLTPRGGAVTVSARPGEIEVSDDGPGLDPADLPRAFDRFYLFERYRSEREVGSGLGLAVVKELVEAMGGEVRAANQPTAGASFTIRLPRQAAAPAPGPSPAPSATP
jgi:signal transduction histidine kinase